jgi:hypothetical protein
MSLAVLEDSLNSTEGGSKYLKLGLTSLRGKLGLLEPKCYSFVFSGEDFAMHGN